MQEYEVYLPTTKNDGTLIDPAQIERIKKYLAKTFGGYSHLKHRSEGAWRMGGVTFRDEVTIVRVLDDGSGLFNMQSFKRELEEAFQQQSVLIVAREVQVL